MRDDQWIAKAFEVSGNYTGSHVYRYQNGQLYIIHSVAAKNGYYATLEERQRVQLECETVARFLNDKMTSLSIDYDLCSDIVRAMKKSFPHFQSGIPVTPETVEEIGKEYMKLITDPGPGKIAFSDQNGQMREIVYEEGDAGVGLYGGWTISEDADWYAKDREED